MPMGPLMRSFANCHSHVFHRALRGRPSGQYSSASDFWSWRQDMYRLAVVLDPDLMYRLARATYREMRLAGISTVGEFHYVHHRGNGKPYDEPHAMEDALIAAAREAGIRICLLDACYLAAGFDQPPQGVQLRFSDGNAEAWASRVSELAARYRAAGDVVIGAAIHSVRAVPADQLEVVAQALRQAPLHVHVSEQPAENQACLQATGRTPVQLLAEAGVWTPRTTAVHATHLTDGDIAILGEAGVFVCFCPTTEAHLADGIGPSVELRDAGARLSLGTDSNTVIDMFAEARALEMHERLRSLRRGSWSSEQLWAAACAHDSLGFGDAPALQLRHTARTAGASEPLWAATADNVVTQLDAGDVAAELQSAIDECWSRV